MTMRIAELPDTQWEELVPGLPGAGPYHTATWGRLIESAFGGRFRVLKVTAGEPSTGENYYVPVMQGGTLAREGFVCGHVGYGGVFHASRGALMPLARQLEVIEAVEAAWGEPCRRFVSSPSAEKPLPEHVPGMATTVLRLPPAVEQLPSVYSGNARNMVRRCEKLGLTTRPLRAEDFEQCLEQIQQTQARVGSGYQTPRALLRGLFDAGPGFFLGMGCLQEDRLVSVGVFLRAAGQVAYYLNGWERGAAHLSPNYLMLDAAFRACVERGDASVDLGYSHSEELRASKLRWGGSPSHYVNLRSEGGRGLRDALERACAPPPPP